MSEKRIDPTAPEAEAPNEQNAARVEKKTSLKRKRSMKRKITKRSMRKGGRNTL